jgi:hypothetical protein
MLTRVQEMIVTPDMHERKRLMFEAFRRVRGAARRRRHAGGTGRADDLAAARPSHQAGAARQHRRLLGAADRAAGAYARNRIHPPVTDIDILKAERVEDIVPRLRAAAAHAPEGSKEMAPELARRL